MKKIYLLLMFVAFAGMGFGQVFITEIADPDNNSSARFVELYNAGSTAVDLSTGYDLQRWTNDNSSPQTAVELTGTIAAGGFYIVCNNQSNFTSTYGFAADQDMGTGGPADSNGDDQIALRDPSDAIIDMFGVVGEDGSGTNHEFEDGRAERKATVTTGNSTYTFSEWNIWNDTGDAGTTNDPQDAPNDFDPGSWIGSSSPTITLSTYSLSGFSYVVGSGPSAEQSFTVEGSNLTADITLTPPTDYEISTNTGGSFVATNPITLSQSNGTVSSTTIYTRLKAGLTTGDYNNENITASSIDATAKLVGCSGTVNKLEPSNHVATFTAGTPTSTAIPLTWSDNDGGVAADGFLVMINTTGTFTAPADGTPQADDTDVSDGSGVANVTSGAQAYTWTNLSPSTQYYLTIYPYTNSGSAINYKTDGTVPTANATTEAAAAEPGINDLEITEVNSTQSASASYVEIYNTTGNELSLDKVNLEFYNDGGASPSSTLNLTGSVAALSYIVIARDQSAFNSVYGFDPDFVMSGLYINGGADGLILTHDDNGTLDQYNEASNGTVSMTDNHLYYRFNYPNDGTDLTADWDDSGLNKNGTPKAANQLAWVTTGTTDWGTGSNWNNGDVPSKGVDVTIISGSNQPIVDESPATPGQCMNMTINSGASVTVMVGGYLTINGTLTNNNGTAAGLIVQSDATGNGSLIVSGSVIGDATVQRYIAKFSAVNAADGWHEIGCPVSSYSVANTDWDPTKTGTNNDLYYWDETSNQWMNYRTTPFDFSAGNGYLVANDANLTHIFTGTLNNADITVTDLSYNSAQGNGWHLLGNPYPSALTWGDANWSLSNVAGTAKIWNERGGNYSDLSSGGIIPSTNGFLVQVSNASNSLTIPKDDRVHNATNNFKTSTLQHETLRFKVTNDANGYYDVSTLGFKPEATEDYDLAFDSHKLFSIVKTAPSLYTVSKNQNFSTNYLPETGSANTVSVDFIPGVSTVYHLQIDGIKSFNQPNFILEDTQAGIMIDLSQQTEYDFTAQKGNDPNRFVLHINGVTAVPNVNQTDGIQVFAYGKTVYLHSQQILIGNVSIFNTLGQQVYTGVLNGAAKQQIRLNQHHGVYFVRLKENNRVITKKIFIQ